MSHRRGVGIMRPGDGRPGRRQRRARIGAGIEALEDRTLMTSGTVIGQGTILSGQDGFMANVVASVIYGVQSYSGSLSFTDSKVHDTFVAASITSVQIEESPPVTGPTKTNGGFTITGTASLNGSAAVYSFTAGGSLPFPANSGSTGGVGFTVTGPNGFSYSQPWRPWDPGQTMTLTLTAPVLVPTMTTLVSSANPSVYEQPVYFTATVTPNVSITTPVVGYVAFSVDGGTAVDEPITNGKAVFGTSRLGVGNHSVVATYLGTSLFASSQATINPQVTNQAGSTTTMGYSGSFLPGLPLSLTARVAVNSPSYGYPTGTVSFMDGSTKLGSLTLPGNATVEYVTLNLPTGLALGSHSITAVYSGDANITGSTSAPPLVKTVAQTATTTSLATSINPVVVGNSVVLTAYVAPAVSLGSTVPRPIGEVDFYDGTTKIGSGMLSTSDVVQITASFSTAGYHALKAVYDGDTLYTGSTGTTTQAVATEKTAPRIYLSSSANPAIAGAPVTYTISVGGGATGTVALVSDLANVLGYATLVNGMATFTISSLPVGTHALIADYGGDANFNPGFSSQLTEKIILPFPGTVTGKGTTLSGQDSLNLNVAAAIVAGAPSYSGSLTYSDSKAGDTFTATSITAVEIFEDPPVSGSTTTNSYFIVTGTATLAGATGVYNFTATVSLPFPANAGSTGGLMFTAMGPAGFVYSHQWTPWDKGETMTITT